jgi:hypothetical protein
VKSPLNYGLSEADGGDAAIPQNFTTIPLERAAAGDYGAADLCAATEAELSSIN